MYRRQATSTMRPVMRIIIPKEIARSGCLKAYVFDGQISHVSFRLTETVEDSLNHTKEKQIEQYYHYYH